MSNGPPQSRNETLEAQATEIELRPALLMSENSCDEPALPWPTTGQTFAAQARFASLIFYQGGLSFGKATALWVKRRFAHDEIFRMNFAEHRARVSRVVSQSSSGLRRGVSRTVAHNQPCCIKIVKWFFQLWLTTSNMLPQLAYARHVPNARTSG